MSQLQLWQVIFLGRVSQFHATSRSRRALRGMTVRAPGASDSEVADAPDPRAGGREWVR